MQSGTAPRIGKFIRAGREKCCRTSEGNFFPRLADQDFILYRLDSCQDFEKAAGGTAAVKILRLGAESRSVGTLSGQPSDPHRLCVRARARACMCFSSSSKINPACLPRREKAKEKKSTRRAINRPRRPNPASALSVRGSARRETRNVSLLNARRHAFRFTSYFRPRL